MVRRTLGALVLDPLAGLGALIGLGVAVGIAASTPGPNLVVMSGPIVEMVRHADVPGCPGCLPDHGPCLATLPPIRP